MSFTLRQLSYFAAAGETGSITLASQRVNISQPAISAAISQLEEELGTQLFVRHHAQGLTLTSAGRSLLREAHLLLRQADGLYAAAADLQLKPSGEMSVGWFSTLAPLLMPDLIRSFTERYPGTTVRSQVSHQEDLLAALRRAEIDVAITYDLLLSVDFSFTPLVDLPPYALVSATHPLAKRTSVSLADLAPLPMVLLDLPQSRDYFMSLFLAERIEPTIALTAQQQDVVRSLVANDFGYALFNVRPLNETALDGKPLVRLALSGDHRPVRIGIAALPTLKPTRLVTVFTEHCRELIDTRAIPGMAPLPRASTRRR